MWKMFQNPVWYPLGYGFFGILQGVLVIALLKNTEGTTEPQIQFIRVLLLGVGAVGGLVLAAICVLGYAHAQTRQTIKIRQQAKTDALPLLRDMAIASTELPEIWRRDPFLFCSYVLRRTPLQIKTDMHIRQFFDSRPREQLITLASILSGAAAWCTNIEEIKTAMIDVAARSIIGRKEGQAGGMSPAPLGSRTRCLIDELLKELPCFSAAYWEDGQLWLESNGADKKRQAVSDFVESSVYEPLCQFQVKLSAAETVESLERVNFRVISQQLLLQDCVASLRDASNLLHTTISAVDLPTKIEEAIKTT